MPINLHLNSHFFSHSSDLRLRAGITLFIFLLSSVLCSNLLAADNDYPHQQEPIGTVRQIYDGKLLPDLRINTFRNIHRLFPVRTVERGPQATAFDYALRSLDDFSMNWNGSDFDLIDVITLNQVQAIMVVKDGEVLMEEYFHGNSAETHWMSMSVVKTITVMLIGAALEQGHIASLQDPISRYLPELNNTAYAEVSVEQVIAMTTGVDWNETYTDPESDRRKMLEAQIAMEPGAILELMGQLPRHSPAGTRWNYNTGETHIAGALVQASTGRWLADYLSEVLWQPLGMDSDASWWLESEEGLEFGGSGLSATLRDYTRIGLFLLNEGRINDQPVVPEGFVARASARNIVSGEAVEYGYGLWPMHNNAYSAIGIFGQYIFVDPDLDLVVTILSAQSKPVGRAGVDEFAFFEALSNYFDAH